MVEGAAWEEVPDRKEELLTGRWTDLVDFCWRGLLVLLVVVGEVAACELAVVAPRRKASCSGDCAAEEELPRLWCWCLVEVLRWE